MQDMLMLLAEGAQAVDTYGLGLGVTGATIGAGIVTIGAAFGLSKIAAKALESIARQPEAAGEMFTPTILTAAMLEGVALFAAAVCFIAQSGWLDAYKAVAGVK